MRVILDRTKITNDEKQDIERILLRAGAFTVKSCDKSKMVFVSTGNRKPLIKLIPIRYADKIADKSIIVEDEVG
jgi:hypothetical protein